MFILFVHYLNIKAKRASRSSEFEHARSTKAIVSNIQVPIYLLLRFLLLLNVPIRFLNVVDKQGKLNFTARPTEAVNTAILVPHYMSEIL